MSKKRILVFDYIRGYLMIVILLNHLRLYPSVWQYFTGRGEMWISAAEGFFFVSGIMVGLIRGSEYKISDSIGKVSKKLLKRSALIYLVYLGSVMAFLALILILKKINIDPTIGTLQGTPKINDINKFIWNVMTFSQDLGWTDFLKYYVIYLILSIPLLFLLKQKMWYLVIGLAILSWIEPRLASFPINVNYFIWFTYFSLGITFGYHYDYIKKVYNGLPIWLKSLLPVAIIIIFVATILLNWFINYYKFPNTLNIFDHLRSFTTYRWRSNSFTEQFLINNRTGILRLPVFLIYASGIFIIFKKCESLIKSKLDWLLGEIGRNSLRAFVIGGIFTFIFKLWANDTSFIYNTFISAIYILVVLKFISLKWIKGIVPN